MTGIAVWSMITAGIMWGLWLAYTADPGIHEYTAGAVASVIATVGTIVFFVQGKLQVQFRARDVLQAVYLPWNILQGSWQVLRAIPMELLGHGAASRTVAVPFEQVSHDPLSTGRAALVQSYMTIAPGTVAIGVIPEQGLLLYHEILPQKPDAMIQHLGARP